MAARPLLERDLFDERRGAIALDALAAAPVVKSNESRNRLLSTVRSERKFCFWAHFVLLMNLEMPPDLFLFCFYYVVILIYCQFFE